MFTLGSLEPVWSCRRRALRRHCSRACPAWQRPPGATSLGTRATCQGIPPCPQLSPHAELLAGLLSRLDVGLWKCCVALRMGHSATWHWPWPSLQPPGSSPSWIISGTQSSSFHVAPQSTILGRFTQIKAELGVPPTVGPPSWEDTLFLACSAHSWSLCTEPLTDPLPAPAEPQMPLLPASAAGLLPKPATGGVGEQERGRWAVYLFTHLLRALTGLVSMRSS